GRFPWQEDRHVAGRQRDLRDRDRGARAQLRTQAVGLHRRARQRGSARALPAAGRHRRRVAARREHSLGARPQAQAARRHLRRMEEDDPFARAAGAGRRDLPQDLYARPSGRRRQIHPRHDRSDAVRFARARQGGGHAAPRRQSRRPRCDLLRAAVGSDLHCEPRAAGRGGAEDHGRRVPRQRNARRYHAGRILRHQVLRGGKAQAVSMAADPRASPRASLIAKRFALGFGLLAVWWLASLATPPYVLPGPERVFARVVQLTGTGDLPVNLITTLGRVVAGFLIAVAIGVPAGILLGSNRAIGSFFEPVLPVLNTVSSAIWAIFAIVWFGLSPMTPIFVVLMTALPLIVTNVWQGTQAVQADFVELAAALRFSRVKTLTKIYLPSIMPYFFSGAR